jgi:hypothetical protein
MPVRKEREAPFVLATRGRGTIPLWRSGISHTSEARGRDNRHPGGPFDVPQEERIRGRPCRSTDGIGLFRLSAHR